MFDISKNRRKYSGSPQESNPALLAWATSGSDHWTMTTGNHQPLQSPVLHGDTECLSCTPSSHSVCAVTFDSLHQSCLQTCPQTCPQTNIATVKLRIYILLNFMLIDSVFGNLAPRLLLLSSAWSGAGRSLTTGQSLWSYKSFLSPRKPIFFLAPVCCSSSGDCLHRKLHSLDKAAPMWSQCTCSFPSVDFCLPSLS